MSKKRSAKYRAARTKRRRLKWAMADAIKHPNSKWAQENLVAAQAAFRRPKQ